VAPSNNKHRAHFVSGCRATWVLFFTHIPFVVNRAFTTTLTESLQRLQQGWARLFEMTESEREEQNAN